MGKNKFEIKPLKNIEEKKEQLPGLPFLTGEAPLPNKTKPKMPLIYFQITNIQIYNTIKDGMS